MHGTPKYSASFKNFEYVNPDAPKGGTLRMAATGSFDSLNPYIIKGRVAQGLGIGGPNYVFESLMTRSWDEPFTLYGLIAETVEIAPDRSWVQFNLRPNARWHDSTPITPDDVVFSFETLRDKGKPNHRAYYSKIKSWQKIGERSVRFDFVRNNDGAIDREMPMIIGLMPVLCKHYWQGRNFADTTLEPPMGSGPYRVAALNPGRQITYERVKDYWGANLAVNRGLYNFDVIRYDYFRDEGVSLEAFKSGIYDLRREGDPNRWVVAYDFPAMKDGRVRRDELHHGRPEAAKGFIFNTRRAVFADPALREAMIYAFDFEWLNRTLFHGAYTRTQSYFPNSELAATGKPSAGELAVLSPWRDQLPPDIFTQDVSLPHTDGSGLSGLRANLLKAAEILRAAGYKLQGGSLYAPSGTLVKFEILLNNPFDEKVALEFARSLARLGVIATVRTVDSAQYQARVGTFDYDMIINQWINTLSPGNEQITYWGSKAADLQGSRNYAGVKSAVVDALASSIAGAETRAQLVDRARALDRVLLWGHYAVPLYHLPQDRIAAWAYIRRPEVTPVYGAVLEAWWRQDNTNTENATK